MFLMPFSMLIFFCNCDVTRNLLSFILQEKNSEREIRARQRRFAFGDDSVLHSFSIVILFSKFFVCNVKLTEFKELKGKSGVKMKLFCMIGLYFLHQYLMIVSVDRWFEARYFT